MATAVVIGVAAAGSINESRKSRKAQQRAMEVDEKRVALQTMKSSIEQMRSAQKARAEILQMGEHQNVGGSSGVAGGAGSVMSQATGNVAFAQQVFGLQQSASRLRSDALKHSFNSQAWSALGGAVAGAMKSYKPTTTTTTTTDHTGHDPKMGTTAERMP